MTSYLLPPLPSNTLPNSAQLPSSVTERLFPIRKTSRTFNILFTLSYINPVGRKYSNVLLMTCAFSAIILNFRYKNRLPNQAVPILIPCDRSSFAININTVQCVKCKSFSQIIFWFAYYFTSSIWFYSYFAGSIFVTIREIIINRFIFSFWS